MESARTWFVACQFDETAVNVMRGFMRIDPGRFGTTIDKCASRLLAEALLNKDILVKLARVNGADDSEVQRILDAAAKPQV